MQAKWYFKKTVIFPWNSAGHQFNAKKRPFRVADHVFSEKQTKSAYFFYFLIFLFHSYSKRYFAFSTFFSYFHFTISKLVVFVTHCALVHVNKKRTHNILKDILKFKAGEIFFFLLNSYKLTILQFIWRKTKYWTVQFDLYYRIKECVCMNKIQNNNKRLT